MPRTLIEPQSPIKRLYRAMVLGRRLDERMLKLQRQGRIGTFAPIKGQEAAQIGSAFTLRPADWLVPSFRETGAMLWRDLRRRFPRGVQLRRRLARARGLRLPEQPVGHLGAAQEADQLADHRPESDRLRLPGHSGRRQ